MSFLSEIEMELQIWIFHFIYNNIYFTGSIVI
jgi:hypothetical protein